MEVILWIVVVLAGGFFVLLLGVLFSIGNSAPSRGGFGKNGDTHRSAGG